MKLLANENFPKASVLLLRDMGYDVVSIGEDNPSILDSEVIQLANLDNRLIITFDRDYGELIFKHKLKPSGGVLYLRFDLYTPESSAIAVDALLRTSDLDFEMKLTVFDGQNIRQRKY